MYKYQASDLYSIFRPRADAQPGNKTASLFAQLPESINTSLEINAFRAAVIDWDRNGAYPYPESFDANSFEKDVMNGVPVNIYKTPNSDAETPTVILVHGGGFCGELINVHQSLMANIAVRFPCNAVLPCYSLAPENKAPVAIDEVTKLLQTLLSCPEKYGFGKNFVLIGYSSGGNLALNAVLNLLHSSETQSLVKRISNLILMSPWLDVSMETTKTSPYQAQQNFDKMLQAATLEQMRDLYLPQGVSKTDIRFSPIYRTITDFKGVPPTTIIVGEIERLFTDAVVITHMLREAEVSTQLVVLQGQSHNHSAHVALKEDVFTPDIISAILRKEPLNLDGIFVTSNAKSYPYSP